MPSARLKRKMGDSKMALLMQRCWSRLRSMTFFYPAASYHAKPLKIDLSGVFIPDPADPNLKEWQKGRAFEAKQYGTA